MKNLLSRRLPIALVLIPTISLVCISPKPALGHHLPTQGDAVHLDLNAPGVYTPFGGGSNPSSGFSDGLNSSSLWHWEIEIRKPTAGVIGLGVRA